MIPDSTEISDEFLSIHNCYRAVRNAISQYRNEARSLNNMVRFILNRLGRRKPRG